MLVISSNFTQYEFISKMYLLWTYPQKYFCVENTTFVEKLILGRPIIFSNPFFLYTPIYPLKISSALDIHKSLLICPRLLHQNYGQALLFSASM